MGLFKRIVTSAVDRAGAGLAHVYVFDGERGVLVEQKPQPDRWEAIRQGWDTFWQFFTTDTAPPLSKRDTRERNDSAWKTAAEAYLRAKQEADHSAAAAEEAKAALIALASHPSESGFGVLVSQFLKKGAVDYKRVPQLKGVDLDPYRKASRLEVRVAVGRWGPSGSRPRQARYGTLGALDHCGYSSRAQDRSPQHSNSSGEIDQPSNSQKCNRSPRRRRSYVRSSL